MENGAMDCSEWFDGLSEVKGVESCSSATDKQKIQEKREKEITKVVEEGH